MEAVPFENNRMLHTLNSTLNLDVKKIIESELVIQGYYYLYQNHCKKKRCERCYLYNSLK